MCVRACVCVCMCVYSCIYTAETNLGVCENMTTTKTMAQRVDDDWVCMCCALRWWWRWRMDWLGVVWVCVCACIKLLLLLLLPDLYSLVVVAAISRTHIRLTHSHAINTHAHAQMKRKPIVCTTLGEAYTCKTGTPPVCCKERRNTIYSLCDSHNSDRNETHGWAHTHTRGGGRTVHRHRRAPRKWRKKTRICFCSFLIAIWRSAVGGKKLRATCLEPIPTTNVSASDSEFMNGRCCRMQMAESALSALQTFCEWKA